MQMDTQVESALVLLAQGNAEQALRLLQNCLRQNPHHAGALHGMACVARAGGDNRAAVAFAAKAVQLQAEPHFHITLGLALLAEGQAEAARAAIHVAVLASPKDPRAHDAMASVLEAQQRIAEAERALRTAIKLRPLEQERHLALAAFLSRHGQLEKAIEVSSKAVRLDTQNLFAQNLHGMILHGAGKAAEAEPYFGTVAAELPTSAPALANHGAALFAARSYEKARDVLVKSAQLAPKAAETRSNLGLVQMALGRLQEAAQELQAACTLQQNDTRLMLNYATVLADLGENKQAEALFCKVEKQAGNSTDAARARMNRGVLYLAQGRFAEGWKLFEARQNLIAPPACAAGLPRWDGTPQEKPVLLYAEQGVGDVLQFLRYVAPAAQRVPVLLYVPQSIRCFVQQMDLARQPHVTVCTSQHAPKAVAACGLMSLPDVLGMEVPFAWRPDIAGIHKLAPSKKAALRIGLCWAGNSTYQFDRRRSMNLQVLAALGQLDHVEFQSLQKNEEGQPPPFPMAQLPQGDVLETARVMAGLDAVITVDTMIAHLGGLLGLPVLLLDRFGGDWRWAAGSTITQSDGEVRSLWYPSVRVIRQPQAGEGDAPWQPCIATVVQILQKMTEKRTDMVP
ncbi:MULTISPECIES: tetratricopeptide repeat protein [Acetobacter]|uniref:Protein O-GlcNAc transferase n=1 Tax=Acetobacter pasteurianus subsp. pasteurianus TaxID=481145 RepID=A0A1Y0Y018_ACEPA|nr:tetratricopeptide repeat protein [Acetobacter pasteurianus]AKR49612.1 N-acetylglucosamine transferase [Acetobacter pasteurianus]ARW48539.1 Protein O-GlcNAc transferase [Acetobacter pasteurianus subsp. pasteurianus]NLG91130.1 tetratricopeptide repeat protein [Acetobacter sp.]